MSSKSFGGAEVIVLLNKQDLFRSKLTDGKHDPVEKHFPTFTRYCENNPTADPKDPETALEFFRLHVEAREL